MNGKLDNLNREQAAKYFGCFAAVWCGIWILLPCIMLKSPGTYDVVEQLILGREWVLGSAHHPPLTFWCIEIAYQVLGNAVLASSFCGALVTFIGLFAIWRLSRWFISESMALLVVLASASYRYLNMGNVNLVTSVPPTAIWCLAIFLFFRALEFNRWRDWCLVGVVLGLGMFCRYSLGILVLSMIIYLCWDKKCRHYWLGVGPYLTTLTAFLIFLPHLYWLIQNDFPPILHAVDVFKTEENFWDHLLMPLQFIGSQIFLILPILFSLVPLCGCVWQLRRNTYIYILNQLREKIWMMKKLHLDGDF